MYKDNVTKEYVGYGSSCSQQNPAPGFIITTPTKAGCYIECGSETFDKTNAFYLSYHPQLTYVTTDTSKMLSIPGVLKITGSGYTDLYGRIIYNGAYQLGKVHTIAGADGLLITGSSGTAIRYTTGFEVLTCAPVTTTTLTTTVPTTSSSTVTTTSTTSSTTVPTTSTTTKAPTTTSTTVTTTSTTTSAPCGKSNSILTRNHFQ